MAKKIEINENWEPVEVEDLDNLFVVIFKQGSFDQGYVEAFDTDDVLMQSAYDSLAKQYGDCGCDELTKIYLIKIPNTDQTVNMCNTGLFNGNCCDPHVIEATRDLFNRADCEQLSCWEGCGLTEGKKKKKPYSSATCGFTDPVLNIKHFNQCMGTGGLQNNDGGKSLIIGDTLPDAPAANSSSDAGSSDGASASAGEGGAIGESLTEDVTKELQIQNNENIEKDIEELEPPIDPEYFPNNMGINLSSVKSEKWVQQDDGQLKTITVEFDPAEEEIEEGLNEATLDYATQKEKMRKTDNGTRDPKGIAKMSDEKLKFNRMVCQNEGYSYALRLIEDEMIKRGLITRKIRISFPKIDINDIDEDKAKYVYQNLDDARTLKDHAMYSTGPANAYKWLVIYILFAILFKRADVANDLRDFIIATFDNIDVNYLKKVITDILADANLKQRVANCANIALSESLNEDTGYSHRKEDQFNIPPQVKILDQKQVEEFIKKLSPEEIFTVGYVTPIHFYAELEKLFELVKATQFVGYTGIDYRDASTGTTQDHAARVANAQRQIDTYKDGVRIVADPYKKPVKTDANDAAIDPDKATPNATGYALNKEGERFSAGYRATNKLALNQKKSNTAVEYDYELDDNGKIKLDDKGNPIAKKDAEGNPIVKAKYDMNKLLFYPEIGSHPLVTYFLDLHDGKGFRKVDRKILTDVLYKKVIELAAYADIGFSEADLKFLKKQGIKVDDYIKQYGNMSVAAYKKALELGIDPAEYRKEHPFTNRWSTQDFELKVIKMLDQDSKTIEASPLEKDWGFNRDVSAREQKPQVRALYTNQIYYLKGKPGTLGSQITEGLEEEVSLDEAKRYVKRYYVRPLNIFCGNKEDIIQALIRAGDQNCSVYSLKNLTDHEDVHLLQPSDIIYYYDDHVLYDKNHVQVMDYDLFVKHEEERKKVGNVDTLSDATFSDMYDDRATEDDLKDKDVIANYKALNNISR